MAVDADAATLGVDAASSHAVGEAFDTGINITVVGFEYQGYEANLQFDPSILRFVPTSDVNGDGVSESWTYTDLGGMTRRAAVAMNGSSGGIEDGSATSADLGNVEPLFRAAQAEDSVQWSTSLFGSSSRMSGTTTETGRAAFVRFECVSAGTTDLHLAPLGENSTLGTTTRDESQNVITTFLADAAVTCMPLSEPPPAEVPSTVATPEIAVRGLFGTGGYLPNDSSPPWQLILSGVLAAAGAALLLGGLYVRTVRHEDRNRSSGD